MSKKKQRVFTDIQTEVVVGGGQTLATLPDGRKLFLWGALPGEIVDAQETKRKSHYSEGIVTAVHKASPERVAPQDPESYISTSPWQIMSPEAEAHYKAALLEEAFELHDIVLPKPITVYSNGNMYGYRNKVEFSFWFDTASKRLDLAFFRRGSHGKIPVQGTSLANDLTNQLGAAVVQALNQLGIGGRALKTLLIRTNRAGEARWQLYVKDESFPVADFFAALPKQWQTGNVQGEIIYSNPKSPASVITRRLSATPTPLTDSLLGVTYRYATESFFQINLPLYERTLRDIASWLPEDTPVVDLYSGVGTIGLSVAGDRPLTLVEINEAAVQEMQANIVQLSRQQSARAILAASEQALDVIAPEATVIVDPPRAGLHEDVVRQLLASRPKRIIYLSCNPVTQARDIMRLSERYGIRAHRGYNYFPRTPHIEHLVVLDTIL